MTTALLKDFQKTPSKKTERNKKAYVNYQCLILLLNDLGKATFAFPATVIVLTFLFWPYVPDALLISWVGSAILVNVARSIYYRRIKLIPKEQINNYTYNIVYAIDVGTGATLGISGVFLLYLPSEFKWLLMITLAIMTMNGVNAHAPNRKSFLCFLLPAYTFFSLGIIVASIEYMMLFVCLLWLNVFFVAWNFWALNKNIINNFSLTYENQELAKELKQKNQALEVSNEQVMAASKAKSQFIADMSQELRLPLQGMLTVLDKTAQQKLSAETAHNLSLATSAGMGLLNLLNDLLDVSRLEKGQLIPEYQEFFVRSHFENIAQLVALNAHNKGLQLYCHINHTVPAKLKSDPVRLSQITLNLLANALKFTEEGKVELTIHTQIVNDQIWLNVDITDTGCGIDEEKLRIIFEPFVKGTGGVKGLGNGLGLAISRELCQLLKGELSVNSIAGKGSVFSFKVPVEKVASAEHPIANREKKLLIVEANAGRLQSLEHQLKYLGMAFDKTDLAKDAMAICAKNNNKFAALIIGEQDELQKRLLINLAKRLKLPVIEIAAIEQINKNSESVVLHYPIKTAQLKAALKNF